MDNIIKRLTYFDKKFPRKELENAIERKDEITPFLLSALDELNKDITLASDNSDYMLHIYAIFLLAQFREKRAFEKIIKLISHSSDNVDQAIGSTLTSSMGSILYSTYNGDPLLLKSVIENTFLNRYARKVALNVYAKLYTDGLVSRDDLIDYLKELVSEMIHVEDAELGNSILGVVMNNHLFEMIDEVQLLYDMGYIEVYMYGEFDSFIDAVYDYDRKNTDIKYIDSAIQEMEWWVCFQEQEPKKDNVKKEVDFGKIIKMLNEEEKVQNSVQAAIKVGRNDRCPCGSGKKYKQCCINKKTTHEQKECVELEDRNKWLKSYPASKAKEEGQVLISDMFDEESIHIDKLVYLSLHHRAIPMWVNRNRIEEDKSKILYLSEAHNLFKLKCEEEGIDSFEEYDKKYKIHYKSKYWVEALESLLFEYNEDGDYDEIISAVEDTLYNL